MINDETTSEVLIPCSEYRPIVLLAQYDADDLDKLVQYCLKCDKFDIETASTGQEIIDKVNNTCFDAIILGLKFPDITGSTLAFLVHQFDPLVSVAFLSTYSSNILIAGAQDLGFLFWSKEDKFKDLDNFCGEIYDLAIAMPCDDETRIIKREFMKPIREEYLRYKKLSVPDSILQVLTERKKREGLKHG